MPPLISEAQRTLKLPEALFAQFEQFARQFAGLQQDRGSLAELHCRYGEAAHGDSVIFDVEDCPPPLYRAEMLAACRVGEKKPTSRDLNRQLKNWAKHNEAWVQFKATYTQMIGDYAATWLRDLPPLFSMPGAVSSEQGNCPNISNGIFDVGNWNLVGLFFQEEPTLRIVFPNSKAAPGRRHTDAEYGHPAGEINFWAALVDVDEGNTLFSESAPGKGDYEPFVAEAGDLIRFYANRCNHYAEVKATGRTRVSFDFRVLPLWRPKHAGLQSERAEVGSHKAGSDAAPRQVQVGEADDALHHGVKTVAVVDVYDVVAEHLGNVLELNMVLLDIVDQLKFSNGSFDEAANRRWRMQGARHGLYRFVRTP